MITRAGSNGCHGTVFVARLPLLSKEFAKCPHFADDSRQPRTPSRRMPKRQELVARCESRWAGNQEMLDVGKIKHCGTLKPFLKHTICISPITRCVGQPACIASAVAFYCIKSSIPEKADLSFSAFLISSALTYGYSPYSKKLEH